MPLTCSLKLRLGALGLALLAGCGGVQDPEPGAGSEGDAAVDGEAAAFGSEDIEFGSALAQIRGHHIVARELLDAGDEKGALAHARHPAEEILDVVVAELEEHDVETAELTSSVEESVAAVEKGEADEASTAFERAAAAARHAESEFLGDTAGTPDYRGSVVGALLATAAHEYEEAFEGGTEIGLLVEYQDAYGFVVEAERVYDAELAADVERFSEEEAEEIEEAFGALEEALPAVEPPAAPVEVEEVERAAELIGHELEETVGAQPLEEADPEEVAGEIEELLDEVVAAHEAGDPDRAAELAAEAYLENYETIEAEVIEYAPEINEKLEPLLGADLRRQIEAGASTEELTAMVEEAKSLLREALTVLEEEEGS